MNLFNTGLTKHRWTERSKKANDYKYYKDKIDLLDHSSVNSSSHIFDFGGIDGFKRKKVNYELFNNIIDLADFSYVCSPYGSEVGELPANLTNRDIVSGKIKVLLGMEMSMPFDWRALAVNPEATTRKEQVFFDKIKAYIESETMMPIRLQAEQMAEQELKGRELTPQEQQEIQEKIEAQIKEQTPDKIIKYMSREHQDPAEIQDNQILEYLIKEQKVQDKFNKMFKHAMISGLEVCYVGMMNKRPVVNVVNSLNFEYDKSQDTDCISEGEWATNEIRMSPSQVISSFGDDLGPDEIDRIYDAHSNPAFLHDSDFSFNDKDDDGYTIRVLHGVWKGLRKTGFLTYKGVNGKVQKTTVDENYQLDASQGDISIKWEWLPQAEECYKIMSDIYVSCRPVIGQVFDIDNPYDCHLPYYGGTCDDLNAVSTSPMDRMKAYQYYYNIVLYRIELLMASDKGKILALNLNAVPKSAGYDMKKFLYFMEANHLAVLNPSEEGNKSAADVTNLVKEIDMSLVSNIMNYIQIGEYIEKKCGDSIGVTSQMEGQIASNDAVTNTRQNLVQSSYIVQPYFNFHNNIKKNCLQALINTAKAVYQIYPTETLSYVLDDMSVRMLRLDLKLLAGNRTGIFVGNSTKAEEAKRAVQALAQAALQNQQAELGDIIKVIKADNLNDAEESIEIASAKRKEVEQANAKAMEDSQRKREEAAQLHQEKQWAHDKNMIILKEKERRQTEIEKAVVVATGFNEDKDMNDNNVPDVLDIAKHEFDAGNKTRKLDLDERKQQHTEKQDKVDTELEKEKLKIQKQKGAGK